jgi:hypothetical protein
MPLVDIVKNELGKMGVETLQKMKENHEKTE